MTTTTADLRMRFSKKKKKKKGRNESFCWIVTNEEVLQALRKVHSKCKNNIQNSSKTKKIKLKDINQKQAEGQTQKKTYEIRFPFFSFKPL